LCETNYMPMKNIYLKGSLKIPEITFDYQKGLLELKGRSTPENSDEIYTPLIEWAKEYITKPQDFTMLNIYFEYFNSSSSKYLVRFFEQFQFLAEKGFAYQINWFYDDDELKEGGEDFEEILDLKFNYVKVN